MIRELPPTAGLPLQWSDFRAYSESLEDAMAKYLSVQEVQIESSGTACLIISLELLKQKSKRRTVIIPAYTCPLVALACIQAGIKIELCDTVENGFEFDIQQLSKLCNQDTLCIIPTHLGGLPINIAKVQEIARSNGTYVIEDAAQALGAKIDGKTIGTTSDITFFSLSRGKGLSIYEGGILIAQDDEIRQELQALSQKLVKTSILAELQKSIELLGYRFFYNPIALRQIYGTPLRHWLSRNNIARAIGDEFTLPICMHKVGSWRKRIGAAALQRLEFAIQSNITRGHTRAYQLNQIDGLTVLTEQPGSTGSWPFLMVLFEQSEACNRALSKLWRSGLGVTKLFANNLTEYDYLKNHMAQKAMPNAKSFASRLLTISNSAFVTDNDFAKIFKEITKSVI